MRESGANLTFSVVESHKITSIDFGLISPEDILKLSVCKIEQVQINDEEGKPTKGGINDLRLGTVDKAQNCETCGCNFIDCTGHFGHIELSRPVFHVGYIETIKKILRCVCFHCSKLLLPKGAKYKEIVSNKNPKKRQALMMSACYSIMQCRMKERKDDEDESTNGNSYNYKSYKEDDVIHDGCGYYQPVFRKDKTDPLKIVVEFKDENSESMDRRRILTPEECMRILKKISVEDCYALGFNPRRARPDWMVINYLIVCPPQVRPCVAFDATLKSEDDLTFQYVQILKANNLLKRQEEQGAAGHIISETSTLLQFYVATLMNNELPSARSQHKNGRPIKSITTRLKGKEGRLRGNLMGKRVDYSARSVITPDPNLSLDELGVPTSIAMNLTFPEYVTPNNINELRRLVDRGPLEWPGAKYIIRDDGIRIDLRYIRKRSDLHLSFGYIVERHMKNGDLVLFNRQPSLHKMSIMGHRVRILPYSTFKLNLSVTSPYNADFDGDEMNMHLPQSLETKAEILEIMHVPKQIVSPQSNRPVMGIVQDSLIGVKLFTHRDNFISLDLLMNLIMWIEDFNGEIPIPAIIKPKPLWTGKQIISMLLPRVNLIRYTSDHIEKEKFSENPSINLYDTKVLVEQGEMLMGIICKKTVGSSSGGLMHCIFNEFGPNKTMIFINNIQRIVNNWLLYSGFTVGISDMIAETDTLAKIQDAMWDAKEKCNFFLKEAHEGILECQPGKSIQESFEAKVNAVLNEARDTAGRYVQASLKPNNHLKNMVIAGSKGNITNISQIIACVGQQNVEGKRIPFFFNMRTLPHFTKYDLGPESRGFVENSYLSGLSPQEFFFHAMGGREGLIDTAVKTSETGYIQRRLVKALEDIMVKYDGTVRNSLGSIVQFLYGEDGISGELIEDQKFEILLMDNAKLQKNYKFFEKNETNVEILAEQISQYLIPELVADILNNDKLPEIKIAVDKEYEKILQIRDEMREFVFKNGDDKQHFPVNIPRIIWNTKKLFSVKNSNLSNIHPLYLFQKVEELKSELILVPGNDYISKEAQVNCTMLFNATLSYNLSAKNIIAQQRFSIQAFDYLIGEIKSKFLQAVAKPGEMVGSIAAQSIGEPATQMTLNTFHFAGVSSKNVTLGVPRLKEIINVAKTLKTPSMTVYLKKDISNNEVHAKRLQTKIEYTNLMNVTVRTGIYYDPDPQKTIIEEDEEMVDIDFKLKHSDNMKIKDILFNFSPWILRIELDSNALIDKNLSMNMITDIIEKNYRSIDINSSDENSDKLIIRIRLVYDPANTRLSLAETHSQQIVKNLEHCLLQELSLKGINEIKRVYVKQGKRLYFDAITGAFIQDKDKEWIIETDGSNLSEVFRIEEVDFTKTISNDLNEIYKNLGVEAVRKALINELRSVLRPYDIYVNYRHVAILCDVMTQRGYLTAITRFGINRLDLGPLRKSSFEETVDILLEAGLFAETDHLTGITENIMVGQLAPFGTGSFDILLNMDMIKKTKQPNEAIDKIEDMDMDDRINCANSFALTSSCNLPLAGNGSFTPKYSYSPGCDNDGVNNSTHFSNFTPRSSVHGLINYGNFTPGQEYGKSPNYGYDSNAGITNKNGIKNILSITSPDPYMSPNNCIASPRSNYNPIYSPYSPMDYEHINSVYNPNSENPFDKKDLTSPQYINTGAYSPTQYNVNSIRHSPAYSQHLNSSMHRISSSCYIKTSSPLVNSDLYSSQVYSPSCGNNYSIISHKYSGNISSPNPVSVISSQNYSPRSPAYNPKSPGYSNSILLSSKTENSPYYSSNLLPYSYNDCKLADETINEDAQEDLEEDI